MFRSAIAGLLFVVGLILASKVSFLFPHLRPAPRHPAAKPAGQPAAAGRPALRRQGHATRPLRVGVIDVYDTKQQAWLLPPVDNQRLQRLHLPADIPGAQPASAHDVHLSITVQQRKAT